MSALVTPGTLPTHLPLTIGLFGTCGPSTWRNDFIKRYQAEGIEFFNPQVADWTPAHAANEALHLESDEIILFPVTDETYASGSLAEIGFSGMRALPQIRQVIDTAHVLGPHFAVIYINPQVREELKVQNALAAKESERTRALIAAHLTNTPHPNLFVVQSLGEMLEVSLRLHTALVNIREARELSTR